MQSTKANSLSVRARAAYLLVALGSLGGLTLVAAPSAFARYGRGLIGETTDTTVTFTMLLLIVGVVVLISTFSFIQWRLDKRKKAHTAAQHAHVADVDWRGGW